MLMYMFDHDFFFLLWNAGCSTFSLSQGKARMIPLWYG